MKNITVSIPDEVYRQARVKAAESGSSVSALVRDYLIQLAQHDPDFERRRRLQAEVLATVKRFQAGDRWSRERVHSRDALR